MLFSFIRAGAGAWASVLVVSCVACHSATTTRPSASAAPARVTVPPPRAARADEPAMHWRGAARSIEVEGLRGDIHAVPIDGDAVEITAVRRGGGDTALTLRVTPHGDGILACVVPVHADAEETDDDDACASNDHARRHDRRGVVDIEIGVPGATPLKVRNVVGSLRLERLRGDVDASTVSGPIDLDTTGLARARSVNGSITARIGVARWTGRLSFATVNGSIDVTLPRDASADVSARTVHGAVTTDGVTLANASVAHDRLRGRLGPSSPSSGGELDLTTVNGSISVHPRS